MIVLDTHAWIWWVNESATLTASARHEIDLANQLGVHPISCWEVAMLVEKGRLGLRMETEQWVNVALQRPRVTLLPMSPRAAVLAARLPGGFHGDPADRLIVASCLIDGASLVTKDANIHAWGGVQVVW